MNEAAWWYDEQESGPPTIEDDAYWQHHVVSKGYPKVKREPEQLPGQDRLDWSKKQPGRGARIREESEHYSGQE